MKQVRFQDFNFTASNCKLAMKADLISKSQMKQGFKILNLNCKLAMKQVTNQGSKFHD
jgi:hypothetical protein